VIVGQDQASIKRMVTRPVMDGEPVSFYISPRKKARAPLTYKLPGVGNATYSPSPLHMICAQIIPAEMKLWPQSRVQGWWCISVMPVI